MIKTVIFDLDGTLLDTVATIAYYCNKALDKFGFKTAPKEKYLHFAGNGAKVLIERALSYGGEWTEEDFNKVYDEYNLIYNEQPLYLTEPYNNIVSLLNELKNRGTNIAVLSNKPDYATKEVVKDIFGEGVFNVCRGAMENVPLKPAPDAVFDIMDEIGAKKEETVFVGDTYVDIETGKNAGLTTIGVLWGFRGEEELKRAGANYIVSDALEIVDLVEKL